MSLCSTCGFDNRLGAKFCGGCGHPLVVAGTLPAGTLLQGRYCIVRTVNSGGRGTVYEAEHVTLHTRVAVKEILESVLIDPAERADAVRLFQNEAHLLATLRHPRLPRVTDFFEEHGRQYLVMDYVEGETLEQMMTRSGGPLTEAQVVPWALQICDVLAYLHGQNPPVIFRDIKPGNVMIDRTNNVKLIDFGIARLFDPAKTKDTVVIGTPGYSPPEQYGSQTDARADLYALGSTLHHLLTGWDPATDPVRPPVRSLNPAVSPQLDGVITKATDFERDQRYASAIEIKTALQTALPRPMVVPTSAPMGVTLSVAGDVSQALPTLVPADRTLRLLVLFVLAVGFLGYGGVLWGMGMQGHGPLAALLATSTPTLMPTTVLTEIPTLTPTAVPTEIPTLSTSSTPAFEPSGTPTMHPSAKPPTATSTPLPPTRTSIPPTKARASSPTGRPATSGQEPNLGVLVLQATFTGVRSAGQGQCYVDFLLHATGGTGHYSYYRDKDVEDPNFKIVDSYPGDYLFSWPRPQGAGGPVGFIVWSGRQHPQRATAQVWVPADQVHCP